MKDAYVELCFAPNVELISTARRFVASFCERMLGDAEGASRVSVASHEMIENAVKYSADGETRARIEVRGADSCVQVRTWNRASAEQVAALEKEFALMKASSPEEHYVAAMRRSLTEKGRAGLGLARIRVEAASDLVWRLEGDLVVVEATIAVTPRGEVR